MSRQYELPPGFEAAAPTVLRDIYDKYLLALQLKREHAKDIYKMQQAQQVMAAAAAAVGGEAAPKEEPAAEGAAGAAAKGAAAAAAAPVGRSAA